MKNHEEDFLDIELELASQEPTKEDLLKELATVNSFNLILVFLCGILIVAMIMDSSSWFNQLISIMKNYLTP